MTGELVKVYAREVPARAAWAAGLTVRVPAALAPCFEHAAAWDDSDLCGVAEGHRMTCAPALRSRKRHQPHRGCRSTTAPFPDSYVS